MSTWRYTCTGGQGHFLIFVQGHSEWNLTIDPLVSQYSDFALYLDHFMDECHIWIIGSVLHNFKDWPHAVYVGQWPIFHGQVVILPFIFWRLFDGGMSFLERLSDQPHKMSQLMRLWYLSLRRPAKAQASLRICAVSPEPSLFAHIKYGSRWRVRPKIRHQAPLDGCACAFEEWIIEDEKCHNLVSWLKLCISDLHFAFQWFLLMYIWKTIFFKCHNFLVTALYNHHV